METLKQFMDQSIESFEMMGGAMIGIAVVPLFLKRLGRFYEGQPLSSDYHYGEPRECFANAANLALDNASLTYCEGLAYAGSGIPTLHAWCLDPDGGVVDVTWAQPERASYCGITVERADLALWLDRTGVYGLIDTGMGYNMEFLETRCPGFTDEIETLSRQPARLEIFR